MQHSDKAETPIYSTNGNTIDTCIFIDKQTCFRVKDHKHAIHPRHHGLHRTIADGEWTKQGTGPSIHHAQANSQHTWVQTAGSPTIVAAQRGQAASQLPLAFGLQVA